MMPHLRSFDDVDGKERGQKKTDDLRAMTTLGPRTLQQYDVLYHLYCGVSPLNMTCPMNPKACPMNPDGCPIHPFNTLRS